jgi:hypothetical protein
MDKEQLTTWAGIPVAGSQNSFMVWRKGLSRDPEKQILITNLTE